MFSKCALLRNEYFCNLYRILVVLLIALCILSVYNLLHKPNKYLNDRNYFNTISLDVTKIKEVVLPTSADESRLRNPNCTIWNCINLYRCGQGGHDRITVYVYPLREYIDATTGVVASSISHEFHQILQGIVQSPYYSPNPNEACLFVPSIDLLNENKINQNVVNRALASLEYWNDGKNHLLFNMLPGIFPTFSRVVDVKTDEAIILGGGFDTWSYRVGFDVPFPVWSPYLNNGIIVDNSSAEYLVIAAQLNILPKQMWILQAQAEEYPKEMLFLKQCNNSAGYRCSMNLQKHIYKYPNILAKGTFCILGPSLRLGQPDLLEMLAYNCIPVVAIDNYVLPFEDVIDWSLAAVRVRESELPFIVRTLKAISTEKIQEMKDQGRLLFHYYFKNMRTIALTSLEYLQCRIFPHTGRTKKEWNFIDNVNGIALNPLFLSRVVTRSEGFTAVILTYDRVDSLFSLIEKLSLVPSLHSILVVWNNQQKPPPLLSTFPTISRPIKVVQTQNNKLSNRFFPYKDIETEAILTIDDDINMLTADEVDFGFEVWREFPDRIVGFPSRLHVWENLTSQWRYDSEWTNQISMVLTGAAFHHKYWSHMYTYRMPNSIKELVDERMNCEDIAMNFLVANVTNKPPIKVTPRKKFKCPECINNEMLSADLNHMRERSVCIDQFAKIYGRMPLRTVEFRADPVLFKDNFPEKLKRFSDMGTL